jgi:cytochrome P450
LECCIKESLRRHPPVPLIRRRVNEDVRLSGYNVPADTSLGIQIYALHRNEEFFPDPEAFKPERFQPDQVIGRNPFAYVPFSAGPRNCIGMSSATTLVLYLIKLNAFLQGKNSPCTKTR